MLAQDNLQHLSFRLVHQYRNALSHLVDRHARLFFNSHLDHLIKQKVEKLHKVLLIRFVRAQICHTDGCKSDSLTKDHKLLVGKDRLVTSLWPLHRQLLMTVNLAVVKN